jgi:MEMO1 family protein
MSGLLCIARQRGMRVNRLGLCNSGDTAGSRDRVVGYGAWSVHADQMLDLEQRQQLINIARQSIEQGFTTHQPLKMDLNNYSGELCKTRASFVTLKINNQLRGCIGTTEAIEPLVTSIANSAFNAAFRDPRFAPLNTDEYENIDLSISVLTPQRAIAFTTETELLNQLRAGRDGLTILKGAHKATFLPAVWESILDANNFLAQLKLKAGIRADEQADKAWRYSAESFK